VSAFDIVIARADPAEGRGPYPGERLLVRATRRIVPSHYVTATTGDILDRVPALAGRADEIAAARCSCGGRRRVAFECVVRGYLSGSAWAEYHRHGTLAGWRSRRPPGERSTGAPALLAATKAESGHDENVTFDRMAVALGRELAGRLRDLSFAVYRAGRDHAASRGIIIADTQFEFGSAADGTLLLIDEVMTPTAPGSGGRPLCARDGASPASTSSRCATISPDSRPLASGTAKRPAATAGRRSGRDQPALPRGVPAAGPAAPWKMPVDPHRPEGRWFIAAAWVVALALLAAAVRTQSTGWIIGAVLWGLLAVWVVAFFRDPERAWSLGERLIVAPAMARS